MNNRKEAILKYMMLNCPPPFDYIYLTEDSIKLISYYGKSKRLKVPEEYEKTLIKEITPSCYCANEKLIEVKIPEGIEAIY